MEIGTDYEVPALQIQEHNSGRQIWCRVSADAAERLTIEMKAGDVWSRKRVRIRGIVHYDNQGNVMRIVDGAVDFIEVAPVDIGKLEDPDFTDGYPVSEYLDHLRENDFGQ